jgi:hypothetical protein
MLWHGSRNTDPKLITNGEEGFDIRFSGVGKLYGNGNYFAKLASYSSNPSFAHRC